MSETFVDLSHFSRQDLHSMVNLLKREINCLSTDLSRNDLLLNKCRKYLTDLLNVREINCQLTQEILHLIALNDNKPNVCINKSNVNQKGIGGRNGRKGRYTCGRNGCRKRFPSLTQLNDHKLSHSYETDSKSNSDYKECDKSNDSAVSPQTQHSSQQKSKQKQIIYLSDVLPQNVCQRSGDQKTSEANEEKSNSKTKTNELNAEEVVDESETDVSHESADDESYAPNVQKSGPKVVLKSSVKPKTRTGKPSKKRTINVDLKYRCDFDGCTKNFYDEYHFLRHRMSHTGQRFFCDHPNCSKHFAYRNSKDRHVQRGRHLLGQPYLCPHDKCEYTTTSRNDFEEHLCGHMDANTGSSRRTKKYVCDYENCGNTYGYIKMLREHRLSHTGHRFFCDHPNCSKHFAFSGNLKKHQKAGDHVFGRPYRCTHSGCEYTTTSKEGLGEHMRDRDNHSMLVPVLDPNRDQWVCEWSGCQRQFTSRGNLKTHQKLHTNATYRCDRVGCKAAYRQAANLRFHILRAHDTSYRCDWDGCAFATGSEAFLNQHKLKHSEDRPFDCAIADCHKAFKTAAQLMAHHMSVHADTTPDSPWIQCSHTGCQYRSRHQNYMNKHRLIHTKPYVCQQCGRAFSNRNYLREHLPTHDPTLRVRCEWPGCEQTFTSKANLDVHMNTHTREKVYRCTWPGCEQSFLWRGSLRDHEKRHRGIKIGKHRCKWAECEYRSDKLPTLKRHMFSTHGMVAEDQCSEVVANRVKRAKK